ncbi:ABC transporter substrate-binding protein [Spirulina major CS-329]|uniref:ABC transporter substrate-binding protein n=2 Tax=Spirulinaceae TaxID=1890448 RepID=UPI00232ACC7F|nr:ABC transporter substrate-binding protein [Spirulina major]MDB9494087.1 ABC transporter substrate-binding protein [Spirulina subsalsa CS-330]MDB9505156.1 ABC transporter substrate-binding protein [Spirulina major CS-329]
MRIVPFKQSPWLRFIILMGAVILALQVFILPVFSQQPVTVRVMMQALEAQQWQPLKANFEAQNPDIKLDIVAGPNDTNLVEDLYTSAFLLGDSPYDLIYLDIAWVPKFAAAQWLAPLEQYVSAAQLDDFLAGDVAGGRYDGQLYRMPFRSDAGMLYYRTDLLAAAGYDPPATFDQLLDISQALQESGAVQWGYVWQGKQYEGIAAMFVEVLAGHGAFWIDPDSLEVGLDAPEAIAALEFLRATIQNDISPPGVTTYAEEETRRLFQSGDVAFLRNWPYVFALAADSDLAGQFAIKPMVHAPGEKSGACQGGWGFGISATSRHPEATWRVIEYLSSTEAQRDYILETGYVPSRIELFNDPEIVAKYSHYPDLLAVVQNSTLRPPIAQYAQASDILQRFLSTALTDQLTPTAALEAAAQETRALLGRAG